MRHAIAALALSTLFVASPALARSHSSRSPKTVVAGDSKGTDSAPKPVESGSVEAKPQGSTKRVHKNKSAKATSAEKPAVEKPLETTPSK